MAIRRGIRAPSGDPIVEAFVFDEPRPDGAGFKWMRLEADLRGNTPPVHDRALQAWTAHRERVLRRWMRTNPGTRPACWWRYESPERLRRIVQGTGDPLPAHGVRCGLPGMVDDPSPDLAFESQATFLDRLGLLSGAERRRLRATAYTPEAWASEDT